MASRYGRNQKRRHLAEIATLQARVEELLGPWERARPGDFEIDSKYVLSSVETKRDEKRHLLEYEAEIRVYPYPALKKLISGVGDWDGFANWNGYNWKINMRIHSGSYFGEVDCVTFELVNVRRPPYR